MAAKIIWSPTARKNFDSLVDFLEIKWGKRVIEKLFTELNEVLNSISQNPELFPVFSARRNLRKCLLRRKTLLFYKIKSKDVIELALFVDARKNPNNYKF
jgi:plasmid stabilization system protein ParE